MFNGFNYLEQLGALKSDSDVERDHAAFFAVPMHHQFYTTHQLAIDGESLLVFDSEKLDSSSLVTEQAQKDVLVRNPTTASSNRRDIDDYGIMTTDFARTRLTRQEAALPGFAYTLVSTMPLSTDESLDKHGYCDQWNVATKNIYLMVVGNQLVRYHEYAYLQLGDDRLSGRASTDTRALHRRTTEYVIKTFKSPRQVLDALFEIVRKVKFTSPVCRGAAGLIDDRLQFILPLSGDIAAIPVNGGDVKALRAHGEKYSSEFVDRKTDRKLPSVYIPHVRYLKDLCVSMKSTMPSSIQVTAHDIETSGKIISSQTSNVLTLQDSSKTNHLEGCFAGQTALYDPSLNGEDNRERGTSTSRHISPAMHRELYLGPTRYFNYSEYDTFGSHSIAALSSCTADELTRFGSMLQSIHIINKSNADDIVLSDPKWYKII